jgi:hypothetical protein
MSPYTHHHMSLNHLARTLFGWLTGYVLQYSMYGHIEKMAEAEKRGIEKAGGTVDLFQ